MAILCHFKEICRKIIGNQNKMIAFVNIYKGYNGMGAITRKFEKKVDCIPSEEEMDFSKE